MLIARPTDRVGARAHEEGTPRGRRQCLPETRRQGFQVHGTDEEEVDAGGTVPNFASVTEGLVNQWYMYCFNFSS